MVKIKTGLSAKGAPIEVYTNNPKAKDYIYLIAGVHGDEEEGVYVLDQLFTWLKNQTLQLSLLIIPVVNPDGYASATRINANKVDLNRNWPTQDWSASFTSPRYNPGVQPLSEPENIFLLQLFKEYKPNLIISLHSWQPMLNHNKKALKKAEFLAKYNFYKCTADIGYATPGSLGTYVDEALNCGIITYELPETSDQLSLQDIWLHNAAALQNFCLNWSMLQT